MTAGCRPGIRLCLFFTDKGSLGGWDQAGIIERETALYSALQTRGVAIDFVTYGGRRDKTHEERLSGINVLNNQHGLPLALYGSLIKILHRNSLKNATIVKSNQILGADRALDAARGFGKKFIARCGYLHSDFMSHAHGSDSKQAVQARRLEKKVFTGADRVIVTTGEMRDSIIRLYGVEPQVVRVIPNYVERGKFRPAPNPKSRRICFIGRLVEQKNLFSLLKAVEGLDAELTIVGDGHLRDSLEEESRRLGISASFPGRLPHEKLPGIMNSSAMFVLPSHYEGHPKALIEAMASGLPVIGTDVPGIANLITDRENGLLCGVSPESIRERIKTLLDDPVLCRRLGGAAREFAISRFDLEIVANSEHELLMELADGN